MVVTGKVTLRSHLLFFASGLIVIRLCFRDVHRFATKKHRLRKLVLDVTNVHSLDLQTVYKTTNPKVELDGLMSS